VVIHIDASRAGGIYASFFAGFELTVKGAMQYQALSRHKSG